MSEQSAVRGVKRARPEEEEGGRESSSKRAKLHPPAGGSLKAIGTAFAHAFRTVRDTFFGRTKMSGEDLRE